MFLSKSKNVSSTVIGVNNVLNDIYAKNYILFKTRTTAPTNKADIEVILPP